MDLNGLGVWSLIIASFVQNFCNVKFEVAKKVDLAKRLELAGERLIQVVVPCLICKFIYVKFSNQYYTISFFFLS